MVTNKYRYIVSMQTPQINYETRYSAIVINPIVKYPFVRDDTNKGVGRAQVRLASMPGGILPL